MAFRLLQTVTRRAPLARPQMALVSQPKRLFDTWARANLECVEEEDGNTYAFWQNEKIVVPRMESTIEWVLASPVDLHNFEEPPVVKECFGDEFTAAYYE
eukprot:gb/GEZN01011301.1/.p2 GENE.gb/GEZN01011301.1/~~gb/GEZN01011301.1/.p2  ORF type:complete len:100 (-),score=13.56 gb/GEZN01011301.1/:265-564(-)